jgi:hypothetical protein
MAAIIAYAPDRTTGAPLGRIRKPQTVSLQKSSTRVAFSSMS